MKRRKKRVGLVLGGGGARGWAHIGVIRALEERGVPVHMVAGTSIGSLVGAALAAGKTDALEETVRALDWKRVLYYFLEVSLPQVILLSVFDRLPARDVRFTRENVFRRDRHTCQYCGRRYDSRQLNIDHVTPR